MCANVRVCVNAYVFKYSGYYLGPKLEASRREDSQPVNKSRQTMTKAWQKMMLVDRRPGRTGSVFINEGHHLLVG